MAALPSHRSVTEGNGERTLIERRAKLGARQDQKDRQKDIQHLEASYRFPPFASLLCRSGSGQCKETFGVCQVCPESDKVSPSEDTMTACHTQT